MKRAIGIVLVGMVLLACGGKEPGSAFSARLREVRNTLDEGVGLKRDGRPEAARETLGRALRQGEELLSGSTPPPGKGARAEALELLARISLKLADFEPGRITFAVRFAEAAQRAHEGIWAAPQMELGEAYVQAHLFGRAAGIFEQVLPHLPPDEQKAGRTRLIVALFDEASVLAARAGPGMVVRARHLLDRAWKLDPDPATNTPVFRALAALDKRYAGESAAAEKTGKLLELARIHAKYGFADKALEYLNRARNRDGRSEETRWVEARYVGEMSGDPSRLERAASVYREMLGRGEMLAQATAGLVRVLHRQGKGDEALSEFGDSPDLSDATRAEFIRIRLDRLKKAGAADPKAAGKEIAAIDDLFLGGLAPSDRADLLVEAGFAAIRLGNASWLGKLIHGLQARFPRDLRVNVLEAGFQDLSGAPLPGGKGEE